MTSNSLTENKEHDIWVAWLSYFLDPNMCVWFLDHLYIPLIPNSSGQLAELIVYVIPPTRRHRAAHVESQIVPLFSQSLAIRVVGSVLNNARRRYEKAIVLGQ